MYTHLHTIEWFYVKEHSTERQKYFYNRIDGRFVAEVTTNSGIEYYICSEFQMKNKTLGIYAGCIRNNEAGLNKGKRMVVDHNKETECTISVDDEKYL